MRWFKHDSDAAIDAKVEKLIVKYKLEGYGLYFYCLELIARNVEKHNLTFELEHDSELIAHRVGIHPERIQEMMAYMVNLKLFESSNGIITCLKMATRTDEYTQKLMKISGLSRQCPDTLRIKSVLKEEKRREQNRKDKPKKRNGVNYPDWLDRELWQSYKDHRIALKAKLTKRAEELAITKLKKLIAEGNDQREIIDNCIENGWKGLFPPKHNGQIKKKTDWSSAI